MADSPQHSKLRPITAEQFPHTCGCGRTYQSLEDLIQRTNPPPNAVFLSEWPEEDVPRVLVWRNCACGSTLVAVCFDRRDQSPAGLRRRELFEVRLEKLMKEEGLSRQAARARLIREMSMRESGLFPPE